MPLPLLAMLPLGSLDVIWIGTPLGATAFAMLFWASGVASKKFCTSSQYTRPSAIPAAFIWNMACERGPPEPPGTSPPGLGFERLYWFSVMWLYPGLVTPPTTTEDVNHRLISSIGGTSRGASAV